MGACAALRAALARSASLPHILDGDGETALLHAARLAQLDALAALCAAGARVDARDEQAQNP